MLFTVSLSLEELVIDIFLLIQSALALCLSYEMSEIQELKTLFFL